MFLPWVFCVSLLTLNVCAVSNIAYDLSNAQELFNEFVVKYNKVYKDDQEKEARFEIFKQNLADINARNALEDSAMFEINSRADISSNELLQKLTGLKLSLMRGEKKNSFCTPTVISGDSSGKVPDSFDWRNRNSVTSVKMQKECGSCWAFSAVANIESLYHIKNNVSLDLSEQQLVDCDKVNNGCNGGLMSWAFEGIIRAGGISYEAPYPYTGVDGVCKNTTRYVQLSGCYAYDLRSEKKLRQVLHEKGPVSVAIDVVDLTNYKSGVAKHCSVDHGLNHGVLLVGYGQENDVKYWTLKNSWGSDWGEQGFFRIKRDVNSCGILNQFAASAILSSSS